MCIGLTWHMNTLAANTKCFKVILTINDQTTKSVHYLSHFSLCVFWKPPFFKLISVLDVNMPKMECSEILKYQGVIL